MEMIYGAEKSSNPERNLADVEGFAARLEVLKYDQEAAAHIGQLRAELARAGTPIGPYDQMIAGHARSQGLGSPKRVIHCYRVGFRLWRREYCAPT